MFTIFILELYNTKFSRDDYKNRIKGIYEVFSYELLSKNCNRISNSHS